MVQRYSILRRLQTSLETIRTRALQYPRLVVGTLLVAAVFFWASAGALAWFTWDVTSNLPDRQKLASIGEMAQATVLFDAHDKPIFTIFREQRIEVPLSSVSPNLVNAVLSVEDQRFYDHGGVDVIRILGAFAANLRSGRTHQGGSTITQQLARQSFLSLERTWRRKIKEALTAALIERSYEKSEILELYLNKVYFGDGLHGVEAAARGFLGKAAADLTVDEAALLAGLIKSPSTYAPTINPDKAIARRNVVLQTMLESGAVDRATYERARQAPVKLHNALQRDEKFGLYFKEQVRRELVERFGWERVGAGGLRVYTTIDPEMQHAAEELLEKGLVSIESRSRYKHTKRADVLKSGQTNNPVYLQGALVAMDARTGEVRVMVGGRNFKESRFNRAVQAKRQPGSAFKPFIFAAALESGLTPATLLTDLDDPVATPQGDWVPEDEHLESPSMTIRTALRTSSNRAAVRALRTVGLGPTVDYINRLRVGEVPRVFSIALGAGEVTLQSMTGAFAAFANGGSVPRPTLIRRIEDRDGQVLFETRPQLDRAISDTTAFLMATMLSDVVNSGTAYRARASGFTLPAAGKTGTTNDYVDAWFVGFTPSIVAGVWIGFDQPRTIVANGYGGELAVPVWADFMKVATKGNKSEWVKRPSNIVATEICRISGKRPTEGCQHVDVVSRSGEVAVRSMVLTEYFVGGTEPVEVCDLHERANLFQRMAGLFGADGPDQKPADVASTGLPREGTLPPAASASAPAAADKAPEKKAEDEAAEAKPEKKRGFWSRLFGKGKKEKEQDKREARDPRNQP